MGRQIAFHMLPEDRDDFLGFAQERNAVSVILRDSDSGHVSSLTSLENIQGKPLCLWNRRLLPRLRRKWMPNPGYFRADESSLPILEFTPSFTTTWEGQPALGQGRLYGVFEDKSPEFRKWFESLVRWIRKNYQRKTSGIDGYVGPAALRFFNEGGYLLPQFLPPRTKVWLAEIAKQHSEPAQVVPGFE
jgi:hypothetical protein